MDETIKKPLSDERKRIAIFLDGTWNDTGDNTNVWRLKSLCANYSQDGLAQRNYYDRGVGGFVGGMFGKGLGNNVREAYEWLISEYSPGDEIFIFGFSRGAFTARSLAGVITKCGLLKPGAPLGVSQLYERVKRSTESTIWKLIAKEKEGTLKEVSIEERWMLKYSQNINIKMVAVWDTVGALGIPAFNINGISRSTFGFLHTGLRIPIENAYHALAIDEHRKSFSPTLWTVKDTTKAKPRELSSVEQRWFVGAHANIGGGYHSDQLAQRPLLWIMSKAQRLGLAFRDEVILDGEDIEAPISDSRREFLYGVYPLVTRPLYRSIGAPPVRNDDALESTVNETIDASVFERWRRVPMYRPQSIVRWSRRHGIDPEQIKCSVVANSPSETAPD
jgi:uncharacterized protein (DUF2235 family)